ncbi:hypothetical protein LEL_02211 [Akanthomyces lecanii RCEF 1005]|uniref:DUF8035 domain-containing protein n=1 Tax=Akanthomyces lecanii RCEF 1005 TaxID=1081108 RepID=A0A162IVI8_CORDF|nr:hypothetical protein LEL_02211 [Akanthomyces lecanii RCEF 1005]
MNGSATALRIDAVDAFARTLYLRTKQVAVPAFDDAAVAVRQMHISLRHLRVETGDPQSVLNKLDNTSAMYTAELAPIVDHCEFALKQLETVLDRVAGADIKKDALTDRIASVTAKIAEKEMDVAFFLDTVQVRPKTTSRESMPDQQTLEAIKHEIDLLASRVFSRHTGVLDDDSEALWQGFKTELERQRFTVDELEAHKAAIKAYIRQLGSTWSRNCGATPTYQGVAEFEANTAPQVQYPVQAPLVPPKLPILPPKETHQSPRNEKSMPSIKADRQAVLDKPSATVLPTQYSFNIPSASMDDERDGGSDLSMTLVSTKDLVAMDSLNNGMNGMHLHTDPYPQPGRLGDNLSHSPNSQTAVAGSPRYQSSNPSNVSRGSNWPDTTSASTTRPSRLAPDRYGRDIPADAQWTQIRRSLISPEVLDWAGVRYEARPSYVAILGRLSRAEISEFARQSAECRATRSSYTRPPLPPRRPDERHKPDTKTHHSDDDVLYDSSDTDSTDYEDDHKRSHNDKTSTRSYPYIVSAPMAKKTSPSTSVKPKPILKNKNENHVRFDPEPHEVEHPSSAPSSYNNDRRREYYYGEGSGSSSRRHRDHYDREHHERDRPHRSHRDRREKKKKSWGETLGAVGIGSAALLLGGVGGF